MLHNCLCVCVCVCGTGGFPTQFELGYTRQGTGNEILCPISDLSDLSKTLVDLIPRTQYVVRLRASNSEGSSDFSAGVTFTTFGGFTESSTA